MPYDVAAVEGGEMDIVDPGEDLGCRPQTRRAPPGRSTWVTSPVTTILEPNPRRVRNIFICSAVVFCASSRMMKASLSVRPRMYASGATSMTPACISFGMASGSIMSCKASCSGRRYGSIFSCSVPGRKPRRSPASTAGRVRMIRVTCLALQRLHGLGHGEVGLAGAGRADAEHDGVLVDRVDVALLVQGLRDGSSCRAATGCPGTARLPATPTPLSEHAEGAANHVRCDGLVPAGQRRKLLKTRSASATSAGVPDRVTVLPRTWMSARELARSR